MGLANFVTFIDAEPQSGIEKRNETVKSEVEKLLMSNNAACKTIDEIVTLVDQLQRLGMA